MSYDLIRKRRAVENDICGKRIVSFFYKLMVRSGFNPKRLCEIIEGAMCSFS